VAAAGRPHQARARLLPGTCPHTRCADATHARARTDASRCCRAQDQIELGLAIGGAARSSDGIPAPDNTFTPGPFANFPGRCTWLCEPGFLTVSGLSKLLGRHPAAAGRTAEDNAAFVIAYPSLNLDEMTEVASLYDDVAKPRGVPIVTVNAELERIRSGCDAALLRCCARSSLAPSAR
jgi:hypothetical protein